MKLLGFGVGVSASGGGRTFSAKGLATNKFGCGDNSSSMRTTSVESSGGGRTLSAKVSAGGEFGREDTSGSMCVTSVESSGGGDVVQLAGDGPPPMNVLL